ncbi:ORF6C domain-containing protein [Streptococcus hyointestinalis]|uniref:ORF6C domain-containing protein n=1 Tax=Streptococcus hyointestinalis TaxID=1337 RepID=UPI001F14B0D1|nr:ORF6C domain-containing protein [Streptococcus hyointestinalis]
MMDLQVFANAEFGEIRTLEIDGQPWFVGRDVAEVLGYSNTSKALKDHVDDEDKGVTKRYTLGGKQNLTIINESGLYSLILSSKLPQAKAFKHWVTNDVLPAIRNHGSYVVPSNMSLTTEDAFIQLFQTQKEIKQEQQAMKNDLVYLKDEQPVNPNINHDLTKERNKTIIRCMGGYDAPAYQDDKLRRKVFSQAMREFKDLFKVPRYDLLKKKDVERAYEYWGKWQPSTNLRIEIENANNQTTLELN